MTTNQKQQPAVPMVPQEHRAARPSLSSLTTGGADTDRRIARVLPEVTAPGARTVTFNSSL
ncbi:hypothetical protein ACFCZ1_19620 [Streptomyces sp. NPDC056224]|uniref:hypothetical protein n=1 Tax=Streptomyces sp. NPDC056224 TaxID=3345750 RepID=UPI0035DAEC89